MDEKKVREAIKALKITIDIGKQKMEYNKTFEPKNDNEPIEKSIEHAKTAIEALEKQLPKRVDFEEDVAENMCVECPSCGSFLGYRVDCLDENYQFDNCKHCGQRLDWSE